MANKNNKKFDNITKKDTFITKVNADKQVVQGCESAVGTAAVLSSLNKKDTAKDISQGKILPGETTEQYKVPKTSYKNQYRKRPHSFPKKNLDNHNNGVESRRSDKQYSRDVKSAITDIRSSTKAVPEAGVSLDLPVGAVVPSPISLTVVKPPFQKSSNYHSPKQKFSPNYKGKGNWQKHKPRFFKKRVFKKKRKNSFGYQTFLKYKRQAFVRIKRRIKTFPYIRENVVQIIQTKRLLKKLFRLSNRSRISINSAYNLKYSNRKKLLLRRLVKFRKGKGLPMTRQTKHLRRKVLLKLCKYSKLKQKQLKLKLYFRRKRKGNDLANVTNAKEYIKIPAKKRTLVRQLRKYKFKYDVNKLRNVKVNLRTNWPSDLYKEGSSNFLLTAKDNNITNTFYPEKVLKSTNLLDFNHLIENSFSNYLNIDLNERFGNKYALLEKQINRSPSSVDNFTGINSFKNWNQFQDIAPRVLFKLGRSKQDYFHGMFASRKKLLKTSLFSRYTRDIQLINYFTDYPGTKISCLNKQPTFTHIRFNEIFKNLVDKWSSHRGFINIEEKARVLVNSKFKKRKALFKGTRKSTFSARKSIQNCSFFYKNALGFDGKNVLIGTYVSNMSKNIKALHTNLIDKKRLNASFNLYLMGLHSQAKRIPWLFKAHSKFNARHRYRVALGVKLKNFSKVRSYRYKPQTKINF
jgi:hypothetical protein